MNRITAIFVLPLVSAINGYAVHFAPTCDQNLQCAPSSIDYLDISSPCLNKLSGCAGGKPNMITREINNHNHLTQGGT